MSDYTDLKEVKWFGKRYILRALSGVVMESSQRSDTYVSGGGTGGNSHVYSTVIVTSQFWIVTQSGREVNLQLRGNLTARNGHVMHALDMVDAVTRKDIGKTYWAAVNSSTGYWWKFDLKDNALEMLCERFWARFWARFYPYFIAVHMLFSLWAVWAAGVKITSRSLLELFYVNMVLFPIIAVVFLVIDLFIIRHRAIKIDKELFPQLVCDVMPQLDQIAESLKATKNP